MDASYVLPANEGAGPPPLPSTPPSLATPLASPPRPQSKSRRVRIQEAVDQGNLENLRAIAAEPGGFLNAELRRIAWPLLLASNSSVVEADKEEETAEEPKEVEEEIDDGVDVPSPHKDEGQVRLDVNRSFVSYPQGLSPADKDGLRVQLEDVIVTILRKHPSLHYFQGYHDIVSVFLLVLDSQETTISMSERMSLHRIRDYMGTGLEPVLGYLRLLHRVLGKVDQQLSQIVESAASLPYFSLSWVLTLMSHDLTSLDIISRLFDVILGYNPAWISYLGVAIILSKKDDLDLLDDDDPAIIHHTLSKLPPFAQPPTTDPLDPQPSPPGAPESIAASEDLMSSTLSESMMSLSEITSDESETDLDHDDDVDSISALSDSMLSDPDVSGPALFDPFPPPSPKRPSPPRAAPKPLVSLDDLIVQAIDLYKQYPLVGPGGIDADEVMGSKSCVFTWELSQEGLLSDADADKIALDGTDIVLPIPVDDPTKVEEEGADVSPDPVDTEEPAAKKKRKGGRSKTKRRRGVEMGVGAVLTLVGVAGVVFAVYGAEIQKEGFREWGMRMYNSGIAFQWG
ncbi:RabGAP/TBC [Meredithblackwellia eburnea MCA 4105]